MADSGKRYYRDIKPGNVSVLAPDSNGLLLDDGNTYLFSGNNQDNIEEIQKYPLINNIPVDPNNVASAIIISKQGNYSTQLGNNNVDSLSLVKENTLPNDIIIPAEPVLSTNIIPPQESQPAPKPSPTPTPSNIVEKDSDIFLVEFESLPLEEGVQLWDEIEPTDPTVTIKDIPFKTTINNLPITYSRNGNKIDTNQIKEYYGDKTPYISQIWKFGCLVTSISMIAGSQNIPITQDMFYNKDIIPIILKKPYFNGNNLIFSKLQKDYPQLKRETKWKGLNAEDIFKEYKSKLQSLKQPIVIRIQGSGKPADGHYVVAVGITKDGNIIIHNPANQKIAYKDIVISADNLFGGKVFAKNGKNYDVFWIN